MGYKVKLQKVERPTNRSYYVNFPVALAEGMALGKGEEFEWIIEDKNTLLFRRVNPKPKRKVNKKKRKVSEKKIGNKSLFIVETK